jgi:transmembrane sensor
MASDRKLPVPLERLIDRSAPQNAPALWRALSERRLAARAKRGPSPRTALLLAASFMMLLGSLLTFPLGFLLPGYEELPLLTADRGALPAHIQAAQGYQAFDLSDGSRVTVAQGARLDVLETSARTASFALRHGRVRFDVRPRGPRSWRIECGAFSVEVVGTKFLLERTRDEVSVSVLHGAVLVRGGGIPDGVQRLDAGRSLRARAHSLEPAAAVASAPIAPVVSPLESRSAVEAEPPLLASARAVRPRRGAASAASREVDALFRAADRARLDGRAVEAAAKLARILERHADDPRAPLAGFALARLQLAALGQPALAAENLKLALSLGLPRALLEDAHGKLAEAYERAGNRTAACVAFGEYRRRFPTGERASRPPEHCQVDKAQ